MGLDIQELQRLRDVAGELTISDDAKLHAIGIPESNPNEWKWHVYLPTDRDYQVHLVVGKIPSRGVPERLSGTPQMRSGFAKSGEMIIGASLDHDSDDQWVLRCSPPKRDFAKRIESDAWLESKAYGVYSVSTGTTLTVDPDQPLVLLKIVPDNQSGFTDGVMIFVDEYYK